MKRPWLVMLLLVGLSAALALGAWLVMPAHPAPVQGSIAFDYRNTPPWRAIADSGFANAVLSPRAQSATGGWAADSLRSRGLRVWFWTQPWLVFWQGSPVRAWEPENSLWALCLRDSSFLRDSTGTIVDAVQSDVPQSWVPDFRDTAFAVEYGRILGRFWPWASGWFLDYGDMNGISWVWSHSKVSKAEWARWAYGYRLMARATHCVNSGSETSCGCGLGLCSHDVCQMASLEGVGPYFSNFFSYARALEFLREAKRMGTRGNIFCQCATVPSYRRVTAAIALLTDSYFNWREFHASHPLSGKGNLCDPEHFSLSLGSAPDTCWQRAPGVWQRMWTRGLVLVNVGSVAYAYERNRTTRYTIQPGDALVVQTRDAKGRYVPWRTDW